MQKAEAIRQVNNDSGLDLNHSNTHFANINKVQFQGRNIWWTEVPTDKFSQGFYLLFCHKNNSLTLFKISGNALDLSRLYYRERKDVYKLYVCSDRDDNQYMHDLIGSGQVDLTNFIVREYD